MSLSLLSILLLLAAAQGFFLTALIFHKYWKLFANRFLGTLSLGYSLILLNMLLGDLGYYSEYPLLFFLQIGLPFIVVPLHYLYAKYLAHSLSRFKKGDWLHFLPFVISEIFFASYFLRTRSEFLETLQGNNSDVIPAVHLILNWAINIQGLTYMILTLLLLKRYSREIKDVFSTTEKIQLHWLRNITYITTFVLVVFLVENILLLWGIHLFHLFSVTSFLTAIAVYAMGYLGLVKSEIFTKPAIAESISHLSELSYQGWEEDRQIRQQSAQRYEKSGLSPEKARLYLENLLKLMETEKPYIDSELTLNQLAEMLSITPHNLSEIINTRLNQNFFDFINRYRVEEVKKDFGDPQKQHLKILSIALDAGFNSKSSFNIIFKKHTGQTPSEYRKRLREK